ncbi:MAG: hypothetical protein AUJ70_04240 [Candidatus Omnitrophica bacterium CG1_02_40_15]|nr:MAG: hypothetical protein AUJ70_04240 [Candidatus Omnitrophica bacterium CG1_02_40_15]
MPDRLIHIKLSKREKYIVVITISVIIMGMLYNFIFVHLFKRWEAADSEIIAKRAKFNKEIRLLENRNSIISEYNNYAKAYKNSSRVLNYIEKLADSLNIKTSNIKPGQITDRDFYQEYFIELQIEGRFPEIIEFLSGISKLPCFVAIKKFDFRRGLDNPHLLKGTIILSKITY